MKPFAKRCDHEFRVTRFACSPAGREGERLADGPRRVSLAGRPEACKIFMGPIWHRHTARLERDRRSLAGPLANDPPGDGLRFRLAFEIESHGSADEMLQRRLIDFVALVDVDGAPHIPLKAGIE